MIDRGAKESLTFFYTSTACSTGAHIALEEASAEYTPVFVKLYRPEAHEEFKKTNPKGTVPALLVGDEIMTESTAIMSYVALRYPKADLIPSDILDYAQCLSFIAWGASSVQLARRQARAPQRFTDDAATYESLKTTGAAVFWKYLTMIDDRLAGQQWIMGDQYTIADCYAFVFYHWGVLDERPMETLKHYTAWKNRMLLRPAVRTVLERERCIFVQSPEKG